MLAYLAILVCSLSGYAGAPPWTIIATAIALAAISYAENGESYERANHLGLAHIVNVTLLRSLLNGLLAATLAFVGGWALNGL